MANIPSKQLHRSGTLEDLQANLSNREIGFCTTDRLSYYKLNGILFPMGSGIIPDPTENALFMAYGDPKHSGEYIYGWKQFTEVSAPYDERIKLWSRIAGKGLYAESAKKDADGRPIASNVYVITRVPNVYGPIRIENDASSHFLKVSVGDSGMIGGLVPAEPPSAPAGSEDPASFSEGDLLVAHTPDGGEGPALSWVHPDTFPVNNSKYPVTSGAVYGVRHLIDPNLYDPNTGEELEITGTDLHFRKGWYYIFGDSLFICNSATSTQAEFSDVEGLVTALNNTLDGIPNVVVYEYELDTNYCRAADGSFVNAETVLTAMAAGKMPLLLLRTARDATVMGMATIVSGASNVLFRSSPADNGSFVEYSNNLYSATNTWTATPKSISGGGGGVFYAVYGSTTFAEMKAAYDAGKQAFVRLERNSPPITYTFIAPLVNYTDVGSGVKSFHFYVINSSDEWARATLDDSYGWNQSFG